MRERSGKQDKRRAGAGRRVRDSQPGGVVPEPLRDRSRGVRIQKAMADAGVASRRDCEALITQGRVRVNGEPVTGLPAWVDPVHDRIEVDGQPVARRRRPRAPGQGGLVYYMLNKPRHVISTTDDELRRQDVLDLLPPEITSAHRLFPVGRLDAESTGLMLLTNDGELANRLTHPRYQAPKRYRVSVAGRLTDADIERLRAGLFLTSDGGGKRQVAPTSSGAGNQRGVKRARMSQVRVLNYKHDRSRGDRTNLAITLHEGQNREIRRMMARLGYKVNRLERLAIGPLELRDLPRGQWRALTPTEIRRLRQFASLPAASGA